MMKKKCVKWKRAGHVIISFTMLLSMGVYATANDGFADHTAKGLVFKKTDGISMEKEVLRITSERIDVEYVFRNLTDKEIRTTIAFPIPDIVCDSFTMMNYPGDFKAAVNGVKVNLQTEIRAVVVDNYGEWWWQKTGFEKGQDITDHLSAYNLSPDCRKIPEFSMTYEELMSGKFSPAYVKLVKEGLACCDPLTDPPGVDYTTRIKYYWEQFFPANESIRISHSYRPSLGAMNGFYKGAMSGLKKYIDEYKLFYEGNFKEETKAGKFKYKTAFRYLNYVLTTANTWKGPIGDFTLIIPPSGNLMVATMDGPFELVNGDLVIRKKNFRPGRDLTVYFFED